MVAVTINAAGSTGNELVFESDKLTLNFKPIVVDTVKMAPLRIVFNMLGVNVSWLATDNVITGKNKEISFTLKTGSKQAVINGRNVELSAAPVSINNIAYVPFDFITEASIGKISFKTGENKAIVSIKHAYNPPDVQSSSGNGSKYTVKLSPDSLNRIGNIMLVDKNYQLPSKYIPSGLVGILDKKKRYLIPAKASNIQMQKEVLSAACSMFDAANKAGIKGLVVSNAYRSYGFQKTLYTKKVNYYSKKYAKEEAMKKAATIVAPPGQSEHQTGLSIDLTTKALLKTGDPLVEAFAKTPEGKWIYSNSWKYGFIIRYPANKTKVTGIVYEPWHIRYVGAPHAEFMYNNKMCLEEYLKYVKNKSYIHFTDYTGQKYEIFYVNTPPPVDTFTVALKDEQKKDVTGYEGSGFIVTKKI